MIILVPVLWNSIFIHFKLIYKNYKIAEKKERKKKYE